MTSSTAKMPFPPVLNSEHNSQLQALQTILGLFQQDLHSNSMDPCLTWSQTLEPMHHYLLHLFLPQHGPNILLFTSRYYNYISLSSGQQWLLLIKTLSWNLKHCWVHLSDWLASEIWHDMQGCLLVLSSVWREESLLIRNIYIYNY